MNGQESKAAAIVNGFDNQAARRVGPGNKDNRVNITVPEMTLPPRAGRMNP